MLVIRRLFVAAFLVAFAIQNDCSLLAADDGAKLTLEFTTVGNNGTYKPRHVMAAWVTDSKTNFVKTVLRQAGRRQKHLYEWNQARGGNDAVDGVTGATLSNHTRRTITVSCMGADKKPLPDGNYLVFVEFTEANGRGPVGVFPFTKSASAFTKTLEDQKNFKEIKLSYKP